MSNKNNNVNLIYDKKNNKIVKKKSHSKNNSKPKKKLVTEELENELSKTVVLSKKEINRKKYQARQQRYSKETKNKVSDIDYTIVNNELLNNDNKVDNDNKVEKDRIIIKENEDSFIQRKKVTEEKVDYNKNKKNNNKVNNEEIELVKKKEKKKHFVLESDIPLSSDKTNTKIRVKRYLKEAIIFAIIMTIINLIAILLFEYVNVLKIFDVNVLNIIVTAFLSLIISYLVSFFIDCLVTEIWVKIKNKKNKEGDINGNSRIKRRKHQENITN